MHKLVKYIERKKHVIWDWNGTLLNDVDHAISTMNHILHSRRMSLVNRERYQKIFEFPVINYYRALGFDFSQEPFEDLSHEFVEMYMSGFRDCPLVVGTAETLGAIKELNIQQSVLSASDQTSLDEMISHFDLADYFSEVYGIQDKFAGSKVDRGVALLASSNVAKEETVLIGDTEHDLEVGRHLGVDVVLVSHGHQCAKRLSERHDCVI